MANPPGVFDETALAAGWFDDTVTPAGWFDGDLGNAANISVRVTWAEFEVPAAGVAAKTASASIAAAIQVPRTASASVA